jgi:hypothetical protein
VAVTWYNIAMKRGLFAACLVLTAALTIACWLADQRDQGLVLVSWTGVMFACSISVSVLNARAVAVPPARRPRRLLVVAGGFRAPSLNDVSLMRGPAIVTVGAILAMAMVSRVWWVSLFAIVWIPLYALTYRPFDLTLTPAGIVVRTPVSRRTVAWGQPFRFAENLAVNPWLLSAAIKWYAEHADERSDIGTQPGYERLLEALRVQEFPEPPPPPKPNPPRPVVVASRLTWTAVALGVASVVMDLVLAATIAMPRTERLFAIVMAAAWFAAAVFAGLGAIALLYRVRRGDDRARMALTALAGLATVSALVSFMTPLFLLLNSSPPPASPWFEGIYFGWLAIKVLVALPAARVTVLLMRPTAGAIA